jgi:hypothetical protein
MSRYGGYVASSYRSTYLDTSPSYSSPAYTSYTSPASLPYESKFEALTSRGSRSGEPTAKD